MSDRDIYFEYLEKHDGPRVTLVPGDSWPGLSARTFGTFLLTARKKIIAVLLVTKPGESVEQVADYFIDMIYLASHPDASTTEAMDGVVASDQPVVAHFYAGYLEKDQQRYIRSRLCQFQGTLEVGFLDE